MTHVDVVVVGSGLAGLTSAAYLSKEQLNVLVLEKEEEVGGLLGSFVVDGHVLDKGARSIIDSGIVFSMLRQLGLHIDFVDNPIRITIGPQSLDFREVADIDRYGHMLKSLYPENALDIDKIVKDIKIVMKTMDVLYGIENPLFLPKPYKLSYVMKTLLPWFIKFTYNINRAMRLSAPINDFLRTRTSNESLIHIITQHFFSMTPTFFALSYFTLYLQYHYPIGSTQVLIDQLKDSILKNGGIIQTSSEVTDVDIENKAVTTKSQEIYSYDQMIWAADTNALYRRINDKKIKSAELRSKVSQARSFFQNKKGADSVLTLYALTDLPSSAFQAITGPHWFFTGNLKGLSEVKLDEIRHDGKFSNDKEVLFEWIAKFIRYNTLEVSIPSLRDPSLSPEGQTGLIISLLFDYGLVRHIEQIGLYESFKQFVTDVMIETLSLGVMNDLSKHIFKTIVSTPVTIEKKTHNTEGSLTGWSFGNQPFPAEYRMMRVNKAVLTCVNSIKQAGQWTFNPAGVPVSILTGKLAADAVIKDINKQKKRKRKGNV